MKIYTKTGDDGQTGLIAGGRVRKDDDRIEAYGTVDELNAILGTVRADAGLPAVIDQSLQRIQNELFAVGAELATPDAASHQMAMIGESHIQSLEAAIDELQADLPPLTEFILPGGSPASGALHVARVVCRRAERRVVTVARMSDAPVRTELIVYLNRLSDLLFVMARAANQQLGYADVTWSKP